MDNKLVDLKIEEVSLVDAPANKRKFLVMKKADSVFDTIIKFIEKIAGTSLEDKENEDNADSGAKIEIELDDDSKEEDKLQMDNKEVTKNTELEARLVELEKSVKEAELLKAENATIKAQLDAAEVIIKAEKSLRLDKEFEVRASVFKSLAVDVNEVAGILKAVSLIDSELCDKIEGILKAANSAVEQSDIFKSYGTNSQGSSSVVAEVEQKAAELRKSDSKLSKEQAFTAVMHNDPQLYARYNAETGGY